MIHLAIAVTDESVKRLRDIIAMVPEERKQKVNEAMRRVWEELGGLDIAEAFMVIFNIFSTILRHTPKELWVDAQTLFHSIPAAVLLVLDPLEDEKDLSVR